MEKYKFKVTKIKENIVEIEAETKYEVMKKLAFYMLTNDDMFCKKTTKGKKGFYVFLNEISNETRQTIIDDDDEMEEKSSKNETENEENISKNCEENDDEIEDDLPREYTEICCENCRSLHTC